MAKCATPNRKVPRADQSRFPARIRLTALLALLLLLAAGGAVAASQHHVQGKTAGFTKPLVTTPTGSVVLSENPLTTTCSGNWLDDATLNNTFDANFGGPASSTACIEVGAKVLMDFNGNAPPATLGNLSTYVGGILVFSCGSSGCTDALGITDTSNWSYYVAPVPGPVGFLIEADTDPHPQDTIDVSTGYPVGYTYFDYVTDTYLCGPATAASAQTCVQPVQVSTGTRFSSWQQKSANYLPLKKSAGNTRDLSR
jgi:hypothetical protein